VALDPLCELEIRTFVASIAVKEHTAMNKMPPWVLTILLLASIYLAEGQQPDYSENR